MTARKLATFDGETAIREAFVCAVTARREAGDACGRIAAQLGTERTWASAQALRDLERELEAVAQEAARALDLLHPGGASRPGRIEGTALPMRERVNRALGYPARPAKEARRLHRMMVDAACERNGLERPDPKRDAVFPPGPSTPFGRQRRGIR